MRVFCCSGTTHYKGSNTVSIGVKGIYSSLLEFFYSVHFVMIIHIDLFVFNVYLNELLLNYLYKYTSNEKFISKSLINF